MACGETAGMTLIHGEHSTRMARATNSPAHVVLITHHGRACCRCGRCPYRPEGARFEMTACELHPAVRCEHWEEVWRRVGHLSTKVGTLV